MNVHVFIYYGFSSVHWIQIFMYFVVELMKLNVHWSAIFNDVLIRSLLIDLCLKLWCLLNPPKLMPKNINKTTVYKKSNKSMICRLLFKSFKYEFVNFLVCVWWETQRTWTQKRRGKSRGDHSCSCIICCDHHFLTAIPSMKWLAIFCSS